MVAPVWVFLLIQLLCPVAAMLVVYLVALRGRLAGSSGQELDSYFTRSGPVLAAVLSFASFLSWPEGSQSWSSLPGLRQVATALLGDVTPKNPNYESARVVVAFFFSLMSAALARVWAFPLNRHLVRSQPRFAFPFRRPVGKR